MIGYAFPGLKSSLKLKDLEATEDIDVPDYVEITADVTDFTLDYTSHIITNGLLADADLDELDDEKDLADGVDDLMDASGKLVDGAKQLSEGSNTFETYLSDYVKGVGELHTGTAELAKGAGELDKTVQSAAGQLLNELDAWNQALADFQALMSEENMPDLQGAKENAASLQASVQSAYQALSSISWTDEDALEEAAKEQAALAVNEAISDMDIDEPAKESLIGNIEYDFDFSDILTPDAQASVEKALANLESTENDFAGFESIFSSVQTSEADAGSDPEQMPEAGAFDLDPDELRQQIDQLKTAYISCRPMRSS